MSIARSEPNRPPMDPERVAMDRALWVARAYYFAFFAALGAIFPLFTIYLDQRGMSGIQIGLLSSLPPLIALASNPFWGGIADRWQAHQRVLAVCAGVAGFASLAFIVVDQFGSILLVLCVVNFFRAPISAILDSTVMGFVKRYDVNYGQQRAFGSIGWVTTSFSIAFIVGTTGINAVFWLNAFLLGVICTILSLQLPVERVTRRVDFRAGLRTMVRLPSYRSLLVVMTLFGAASACQANFISLDVLALGGTTALIGITNSMGALLEMPVMFQGHRWFRRHGCRSTILLSNAGFAIAWVAMAMAQQAWQLTILNGVVGFFFALFWTAIVGYAASKAAPGMAASAQTIAQAAHGGLGWALGSILSGVLWEWGGGTAIFLAAAIFVTIGGIYFGLGTRSEVA